MEIQRQVIAYADQANREDAKSILSFYPEREKESVAVTAVARELACFVWGMMTDRIEGKCA